MVRRPVVLTADRRTQDQCDLDSSSGSSPSSEDDRDSGSKSKYTAVLSIPENERQPGAEEESVASGLDDTGRRLASWISSRNLEVSTVVTL